MLDYRDPIWATFDIQPILGPLAVLGQEFPVTPATVIPPGPTEPPAPPPTATYIDPNVALAILDVEAAGSGFVEDRMKIRLEAHIFRERMTKGRFDSHFLIADSRPWERPQYYRFLAGDPWTEIHTSQDTEWEAFRLARSLDNRAAMESISMGIAQVMGFNHRRVGYDNLAAMFDDYSESEAAQIVGFFNYILTDAALMRAVRSRDWREIAKRYNGAGNVDVYAPRLEAAYRARANV